MERAVDGYEVWGKVKELVGDSSKVELSRLKLRKSMHVLYNFHTSSFALNVSSLPFLQHFRTLHRLHAGRLSCSALSGLRSSPLRLLCFFRLCPSPRHTNANEHHRIPESRGNGHPS